MVADDAALAALIADLRGAEWVALDTEFMREKTYYPKLCLVQLATPERIACIDPLALADLAPLAALLSDPATLKVLHAAGQDMEVLLHEAGVIPEPVFDTQIAAALLGHPDQIGYARLVQNLLGVQLDKAHTRSDWSRRPLSADETAYAADDVRYLAALYPQLRAQLRQRGRLDWLDPEFQRLADPARYRPDPASAWKRVKGPRHLRPAQQQALEHLAAWRERTAMAADRPRGWIVKDDVLGEIARRRPADREALAAIRGLPEAVARKHGEAILAELASAANAPDAAATPPPKPLEPAQAALADLLMVGLRARAAEIEISPAALASRKELEALAAGERDLPLLQGWRLEAAGKTILELLEGRLTLRAQGGGVICS